MEDRFVLFSLGKVRYGIKLENVVQILRYENVMEVPKAPKFVIGVINLRGEVFPVINMWERFGLESESLTKKNRIIVVKYENRTFGLLVKDVKEIIELEDENIERDVTSVYGLHGSFIDGIAKMEDGLIIILNIKEIIESDEDIHIVK